MRELPLCSPRKRLPEGAPFPLTHQSCRPTPHLSKGRGHAPHDRPPEAPGLSRLTTGVPDFYPLKLLPQQSPPTSGPGHPENKWNRPHSVRPQPGAAQSKAAALGGGVQAAPTGGDMERAVAPCAEGKMGHISQRAAQALPLTRSFSMKWNKARCGLNCPDGGFPHGRPLPANSLQTAVEGMRVCARVSVSARVRP